MCCVADPTRPQSAPPSKPRVASTVRCGRRCAPRSASPLAVAEEYDGAGASLAETALAVEEVGAVLAPVPVFSSAVLTVGAVMAAGDETAAERLLPALASGEKIGALCWAGQAGWTAPGVTAEAGLLRGTAEYVIDGESADVFW